MNKEDIIRMAREAEVEPMLYDGKWAVTNLERFAALVAAAERERCYEFIGVLVEAEREACAKVAEQTVCDTHLPTGVKVYGSRAAKAIRARGQA